MWKLRNVRRQLSRSSTGVWFPNVQCRQGNESLSNKQDIEEQSREYTLGRLSPSHWMCSVDGCNFISNDTLYPRYVVVILNLPHFHCYCSRSTFDMLQNICTRIVLTYILYLLIKSVFLRFFHASILYNDILSDQYLFDFIEDIWHPLFEKN